MSQADWQSAAQAGPQELAAATSRRVFPAVSGALTRGQWGTHPMAVGRSPEGGVSAPLIGSTSCTSLPLLTLPWTRSGQALRLALALSVRACQLQLASQRVPAAGRGLQHCCRVHLSHCSSPPVAVLSQPPSCILAEPCK